MDHLRLLYHHTSPDNAMEIRRSGRFLSRETRDGRPEVCFTTRRGGHAAGFGSAVVLVVVPEELLRLDDEFPDGEEHYRAYADDIEPGFIRGINLLPG